MSWQLAEAKNKLSEVVRQALTKGPQRITRRDEAVMVIAESEYKRLTGQNPSFKEFLLGPVPDLEDLDLSRDPSPEREFKL